MRGGDALSLVREAACALASGGVRDAGREARLLLAHARDPRSPLDASALARPLARVSIDPHTEHAFRTYVRAVHWRSFHRLGSRWRGAGSWRGGRGASRSRTWSGSAPSSSRAS